jgi:hypothetical protein
MKSCFQTPNPFSFAVWALHGRLKIDASPLVLTTAMTIGEGGEKHGMRRFRPRQLGSHFEGREPPVGKY